MAGLSEPEDGSSTPHRRGVTVKKICVFDTEVMNILVYELLCAKLAVLFNKPLHRTLSVRTILSLKNPTHLLHTNAFLVSERNVCGRGSY